MGRPEILQKVVPYYDHDFSEKPDRVRISFRDGSTAIYEIRVEQPHPLVQRNIQILNGWKGYVNQPARRRRKK